LSRWWEPFVVEDSHLCSLCRGLCCQNHPGLYLDPLQFMDAWHLSSAWSLRDVLNSHSSLSLKLCMGVPIPQPQKCENGCVFWSPKGCVLPRYQRPLECLVLVPSEESIFEGEPRCSISPKVSYLRCFERWRSYYRETGISPSALIRTPS
jgi:hypothetical protein